MNEDAEFDQLTKTEDLWWKSFKKIVNKMPETLEVSLNSGGGFNLHRAGADRKELDESGNHDNVPYFEGVNPKQGRFIPNTENL